MTDLFAFDTASFLFKNYRINPKPRRFKYGCLRKGFISNL